MITKKHLFHFAGYLRVRFWFSKTYLKLKIVKNVQTRSLTKKRKTTIAQTNFCKPFDLIDDKIKTWQQIRTEFVDFILKAQFTTF